jgi:hypothetical protein
MEDLKQELNSSVLHRRLSSSSARCRSSSALSSASFRFRSSSSARHVYLYGWCHPRRTQSSMRITELKSRTPISLIAVNIIVNHNDKLGNEGLAEGISYHIFLSICRFYLECDSFGKCDSFG